MAILKDERNGITLTLSGYDELLKKLDDTNRAEMSETMLLAAEPIIKSALDAEMARHPGKLQQSLQSTGAQQNAAGQWYLAYRATCWPNRSMGIFPPGSGIWHTEPPAVTRTPERNLTPKK